MNAWVLLLTGIAVLWRIDRGRGRLPLLLLLVIPSAYVGVRIAGVWDGRGLIPPVAWTVGDAAAVRVRFRIHNDNLVYEKCRQRPIFGWGRWGRSHVPLNDGSGKMTVVDSMWTEAFGECGVVGLAALLLAHLLPGALYWHRLSLHRWAEPSAAPGAVFAVIVALFAIDHCMNAMINPVFPLAAGGLTGFGTVGGAASNPRPVAAEPPPVPEQRRP